jgi:drug/metabolite transporter (DMT)-like permease
MDKVFWINIFIVSVLSTTIAATLYYVGLKVLGSKKCAEFSLLTPFFAIALGAIFFSETLTIRNAIGTIMAVSALFVLNNVKFKDLTSFR